MALIRMHSFFSVVVAISFLLPAISYATDYVVGDDGGWWTGVDYTEWAKGKTFRIGDTLTFLYYAGQDTVVEVDGKGFNGCSGSPNSGVLTSGNDKIILTTTGNKWYISGVSDHCDAGQKLKITVFPKSMIPAPSPAPETITLPFFPGAPEPVATPGYLPVEAGSNWANSMAPLPVVQVPAPAPAPTSC